MHFQPFQLRSHPALNDGESALKPTLMVAALSPGMPSILNLNTNGPLPLLCCMHDAKR